MNRRTFCQKTQTILAMTGLGVLSKSHRLFATESDLPEFPIVDTHVHLWDIHHLEYKWVRNSKILNRSYLPKHYTQASEDVYIEKIVFVEAAVASGQKMKEVEWVSTLAQNDPRIQGIVASAPLETGDEVIPALETLAKNSLVKGIRRGIRGHKDAEYCLQPSFIKGVQNLNRVGFSFDILGNTRTLPAAAKLIKACPDVSFILDHIGVPDIKNDDLKDWRKHIKTISKLPNVVCKVSGVATVADHENWKPADLKPAIDHVINSFGIDRCAFGSDWPVMLRATSFIRWIETLFGFVKDFTQDEQLQLFKKTAEKFYRLD